MTNSKHHQCIEKLGNHLQVIAHTKDGVIEGIQHESKKIFGVQWHPEYTDDLKVFEIFKTLL